MLNNCKNICPHRLLGNQVSVILQVKFSYDLLFVDKSVPSIFPIDFNSILESIRELNVLAGENETHFEPQNANNEQHISTLKRTEPIILTLYANGIFLFNGPFRSYNGTIFC